MTITFIPADLTNLNDGQKKVISKIRSIYKDNSGNIWVYVKPKIKRNNYDFLLIDADYGVAVINTSDINLKNISEINKTKLVINGNEVDNPSLYTKRSLKLIEGIIQSESLFEDDEGESIILVSAKLIFTQIKQDYLNNNYHFFNHNPVNLIGEDKIKNLTANELFQSKLKKSLSDELIQVLRASIFPEIKVNRPKVKIKNSEYINQNYHQVKNSENIIQALDAEQEKFARRIPYGHYMVSGIPGSGKTVILLTRALHLSKLNPKWKIKIITFTKALSKKLNERFEKLKEECSFMEIYTENIEIINFHKFAFRIAGNRGSTDPNQNYWDTELAEIAITKAESNLDAILIDEYQDFNESWFKLCIKCLRKHQFTRSDGSQDTMINLFMAGDRLQKIYDRDFTWKNLGINMQGRSKCLKKTYRTGGDHILAALKLLNKNEELKNEVELFYEGSDDIVFENNIDNQLEMINGDNSSIYNQIINLVKRGICEYKDIMVLSKKKKDLYTFYRDSPNNIKNNIVIFKEYLDDDKTNLITFHSAKGIEINTCFLLGIDKDFNLDKTEDLKLLYVGMTRASQNLYIQSNKNFI